MLNLQAFQATELRELSSWSLVDGDGMLCAFGQYHARLGHCHLGHLAVAPGLAFQ